MKGDDGIPQRNGSLLDRWDSVAFGTDAVAPAAAGRPTVTVASASTQTYVSFNGIANGLVIDQSYASLQRPFMLFVVDRYTPGSLGPRLRNVQGSNRCDVVHVYFINVCCSLGCVDVSRRSTAWVVGLDAGTRTFSVAGTASFDASTLAPNTDSWAVTTVIADKDTTLGFVNGELRFNRTASSSEPGTLSIGGYYGPAGTHQVCLFKLCCAAALCMMSPELETSCCIVVMGTGFSS